MKTAIKNNQSKFLKIARKYGLDFLVLFGSRANGLANSKSDYDIGYSLDDNLGLDKEYNLGKDLKAALSSQKVDIINLRHSSPLLAKKVLLEGKLLTENTPHSFAKEQIRAFHNYIETKPLRKLYDR